MKILLTILICVMVLAIYFLGIATGMMFQQICDGVDKPIFDDKDRWKEDVNK